MESSLLVNSFIKYQQGLIIFEKRTKSFHQSPILAAKPTMRALHKLQALVPLLTLSSITTATPVAKTGSDLPSEPTGPNMPYDITLEIQPPPIPNQPFVKVRMHEGTKKDKQREAGYAIGSFRASLYSPSSDDNSENSDEGQGDPIPSPSIRIDEARVVFNDAVKCAIEPADPARALMWPNYIFSKQSPLSQPAPPAARVTCAFLDSVPPDHVRVELYPPVRERPTVDIPLAENGRGYVSLLDEDEGVAGRGDDGGSSGTDVDNDNIAGPSPGKAKLAFSRAWIISGQDNVECSLVSIDTTETNEEVILFDAEGFLVDDIAEDITGVECHTMPSMPES